MRKMDNLNRRTDRHFLPFYNLSNILNKKFKPC